MKRFFSEPTIITLIVLITIFLNIIPFLYRLINTPPDKSFTGAQYYTLDYNIYLGHFKEGADGTWLVHDKHTGEPQKGFLLRREYIIWGFLTGKILGLPIIFVYHSSRIVGGIVFLFLFYLLLKELFPDEKSKLENKTFPKAKYKRLLAFFLGTLVAGFPKYYIDPKTGKQAVDLFLFWFTEIDAGARYVPLFHYLVGYIILITILILFIKFLKSEISYHLSLFIAIILGFLAPLIHPATFVTIYLTFAIYLILRFVGISLKSFIKKVSKIEVKKFFTELTWVLFFVIITLPVIPFLNSEVNTFPWNEIAKWDKATQTPVEFNEYIMAIGPTFFLGLIGMILIIIQSVKNNFNRTKILKEENIENDIKNVGLTNSINNSFLLILSFPIATFLLVFVLWPYLLDINRIRFLQVPIFIPFAIFSAIAILQIIELVGNVIKKARFIKNIYLFKICALIFVISALLYITLPALKHGIMREVTMFPPGDNLIYPDKKWVEAMNWLNKNTKRNEVVLATFHASGLIPGLAGNTSYSGHPWSTVNFNEKEALITKFFQSQMSENEAKQFFKDGYINYIFYGYQEKSFGGDINKYENLITKIYETPAVTIYQIKKML